MTNKFNVGDVVKATNNIYRCTTLDNEWQGVVTKVFADGGGFHAKTTFVNAKEHSPSVKIGETFVDLDPKHFELVPPKPTKKQRIANAEQAISVLDSEVGTIKMRLDEYEALVGRVSVLEEKQAETVEIKAGDYVKNTGKERYFLTIGKVYEVLRVDDDGDYRIIDDDGDNMYIKPSQCEKVAKPVAEQTQYKVGDVVIIGGDVRVIVFVSEGLYRYRNVLASNVGDDLSPYWSAHTAIKRYATAEEIASVGK